MNRLDFLSPGNQPDRVYEKPLMRFLSVDNEGLLCLSPTINNYDEEKFEW